MGQSLSCRVTDRMGGFDASVVWNGGVKKETDEGKYVGVPLNMHVPNKISDLCISVLALAEANQHLSFSAVWTIS